MKKSEMIEILKNSFIYHMNPHDKCCESDEEMYNNILKDLEKAGMLPPFTGKVKQVDILDRWSQDTGKKEMCRVIISEWDEE